jgi:hypothetical protein
MSLVKRFYRVGELKSDSNLIRIRLFANGRSHGDERNVHALVGLREDEISFALPDDEARDIRLGDVFSLTLDKAG